MMVIFGRSSQPIFNYFLQLTELKHLAPDHPEWKTQQPFKAVLEDDMKELAKHGEHGLLELVMAITCRNDNRRI